MAAGLTQNGVRVSLVELGSGSAPQWLAKIPNASYLSLHTDSKLLYPIAVRRLARFLKDEHVDILHAHLFFAGLIGVLAKRLHKKTTVALMRHHTSGVHMLGSRLHVTADKWMAEKADHVTTVSSAVREYMYNVDHIERSEIDVVYTGFDFEKMAPSFGDRMRVRREFGFAADNFVIGYVANFINGKGHKQLIEAFSKIADEIPEARLFLVGRGMLQEVQESAARFSEGQIVFAGWRDDISACLNAMDIFVQPSLSEAFSQVLIEAMGVGLPVVATRVGAANEVIVNGENGLLIEPDKPEEIYFEVERLLSDASMRQMIAKKGMSLVRDRYTIPIMIERLMFLYCHWLERKRLKISK
ncbi:MAG: glycosyltransferase family 4 protein [Chloracidobacterium sp.]|nr:glycosyltransferase family 4 protein [Chloracidobacterium sp.]